MKIGVDYYPEHWDQAIWEKDAQLMQKTGVKIARLAEFSWCRLEPQEGSFNFAWLDESIDILYKHGIHIVLGTPTCTPPNWLVEKYSDVLPVDSKLDKVYPGVRGHRCTNSASLRKYTSILLENLSKHYAENPAVTGWQIDNEMFPNLCHCEACNLRFREWLKNKYGTLENLNKEWGTVVWSGEYSSWTQVTTPFGGSPHQNPSYLLDYSRFCNESTIEYSDFQIEIIRKNCKKHFITHNMFGFPFQLDYYKLFEKMDFAALDYYPDTRADGWYGAVKLDLARGVKNKNFWIMEQLSGSPGCWFPMWRTPQPGAIRAYAWQSISRGADTVVHFRWRSAAIGAEQFWHGLIDHSNVPGRRFKEFAQFCEEVNNLAALLDGTELKNHIAILHSHEQYNALKIQPQVEGMDYYDNLKIYHKALTSLGVGVDIISSEAHLDIYRLVIMPPLYLLDEKMSRKIEEYVHSGGIAVVSNRTGVKNMNNVCWMKQLPGLLAECTGVVIDEYDPVGSSKHKVRLENGSEYECSQWCDIIKPETAKVIGWYTDDFFAGSPAATVNKYGNGKVLYIGANFECDFYKQLFSDLLKELQIDYFKNLPEGVELSVREKDGSRILFVLNLTSTDKQLSLEIKHKSVLGIIEDSTEISLKPYDVKIFEI